jgi:putative component of membrane protein insertase Oxa1/YidC/SpoIIIJ protein YidD
MLKNPLKSQGKTFQVFLARFLKLGFQASISIRKPPRCRFCPTFLSGYLPRLENHPTL